MSEGARLDELTVAIVGIGLMGGSLGLALAGKVGRRLGVDPLLDEDVAVAVVEAGVVDEVLALDAACARADVIVLAAPVRAVVELVSRAGARVRTDTILTDVAGTKSPVCAAMDALPAGVAAIGGHPMCGGVASGPGAATPILYRGATWALCETARTTPRARAVVDALVEAAGATAVTLDREVHDEAAASISHLPHVVARALLAVRDDADARTDGAASALAAAGFARATLGAQGDAAMWDDVLATNAAHVRAAVVALQRELDTVLADLD